MFYRWEFKEAAGSPLDSAPAGYEGIPPLVVRCLRARGVVDAMGARQFLEPRLRDLTDPFDPSADSCPTGHPPDFSVRPLNKGDAEDFVF